MGPEDFTPMRVKLFIPAQVAREERKRIVRQSSN